MSETRKIAAILVADVVGYSRLAGADEDRILARLRALCSHLIDPTIAGYDRPTSTPVVALRVDPRRSIAQDEWSRWVDPCRPDTTGRPSAIHPGRFSL
jgi:hypothetical protein